MHILLALKSPDRGTDFKSIIEGEGEEGIAPNRVYSWRFPQIYSMKATLPTLRLFFGKKKSVYVIISLNIISVAQPTAALVQRKFGIVASSPSHVRAPTSLFSLSFFTPCLTLSFALAPAPSSCARFAPGWLITGRSNIFEFMGGLSHTVPASGCMWRPRLSCFSPVPNRYDSNGILMA